MPEFRILLKVLHPTCLYMHKYFQMAPAVNIYTHEYPSTSKYHMLPTHLRGDISAQKICLITIGLHGNLQISHGKTAKHANIFEILADMQTLLSFKKFKTKNVGYPRIEKPHRFVCVCLDVVL